MRKTLITLALVSLAACASVGREITPEQLTEFKAGETTIAEVIAKLGQPTSNSSSSLGTKTLVYSYGHYQARPATFIPIVGLFAGGADVKSSATVFLFNKEGKLTSYYTHQTQVGSGTGLAAGTYQPVDYSQPQEASQPTAQTVQ